jgi:hypothetical protein
VPGFPQRITTGGIAAVENSSQLIAPAITTTHSKTLDTSVESASSTDIATAQIVNVGLEDASPLLEALASDAGCEVINAAAAGGGGNNIDKITTRTAAAAMNNTTAVDTSNSYDYRKVG